MPHDPVQDLIEAATDLVESVSRDENGELIGGIWMNGHGGLLSPDTHRKADRVRRALNSLEKSEDNQ